LTRIQRLEDKNSTYPNRLHNKVVKQYHSQTSSLWLEHFWNMALLLSIVL